MNGEWWARIEAKAAEDDDRRGETTRRMVKTVVDHFVQAGDLGECESPIERMLAWSLSEPAERFGYEVIPQYKIDRYRFDFAIKSTRADKVLAVVECDGRDFHSSPEQIANDGEKDKIAEENGLRIFRFSGREIYKDPSKCANEIFFRLWPR